MNETTRSNQSSPNRRTGLLVATTSLVVLAMMLPGCKNRQRRAAQPAPAPAKQTTAATTKTTSAQPVAEAAPEKAPVPTIEETREILDRTYVIGPTAASRMGFRIDWQMQVPQADRGGIKQLHYRNGDLLVADTRNRLTLIAMDDGGQVWHAVPLPPNEMIHGINQFDFSGTRQMLVTTDTDIFVIDSNTGHLLTRQNMDRIPTTNVIKVGPDIVYGCGDGRVVWHNAAVGYELRANKLRGAITAAPLLVESDIVAVSGEGEVMLMGARDAQRVWMKRLNAGIAAGPAGSTDAVYVAGLDQSIWCLDRNTGLVQWKYFTESPLKTAPTLLGDRLFQFVPSEGYVCLEALPANSPRGNVIWRNPALMGEILTAIGNDLLVWNPHSRDLMLVDADRGDIKVTSNLPNAAGVETFRAPGQPLMVIAYSSDGRIQRLVPSS